MPTRLYLTSLAAGYSPATIRGGYDGTAGCLTRALGTVKGGVATGTAIAETSSSATWNQAMHRSVSAPLTQAVTISGTLDYCGWVNETNASMNAVYSICAYVTAGNTDTARGYLVGGATSTVLGTTEWAGSGNALPQQTLNPVAAQVGDRIVVVVGYQAQNTKTTSYSGQFYFGGSGTDSLPAQGANTDATWVEFSQDNLMGDNPSVSESAQTVGEAVTVQYVLPAQADDAATLDDTTGLAVDIIGGAPAPRTPSVSDAVGHAEAVALSVTDVASAADAVGTAEAVGYYADTVFTLEAVTVSVQAGVADVGVNMTAEAAITVGQPAPTVAVSDPRPSVTDAAGHTEAITGKVSDPQVSVAETAVGTTEAVALDNTRALAVADAAAHTEALTGKVSDPQISASEAAVTLAEPGYIAELLLRAVAAEAALTAGETVTGKVSDPQPGVADAVAVGQPDPQVSVLAVDVGLHPLGVAMCDHYGVLVI